MGTVTFFTILYAGTVTIFTTSIKPARAEIQQARASYEYQYVLINSRALRADLFYLRTPFVNI